jgi:radical SAM superfamily enzyme YgiQ (UPF0313 family)
MYEDPHERQVMRPYPPLGILYISSYLKQCGFDVQVFDTTFSSPEAFRQYIERERPSLVGVYCNMMTRQNVLKMVGVCKSNGCMVILGGPDPANYAEEYLIHGADVVVIGEGEPTLQELIPHITQFGLHGMDQIAGIVYREDDNCFVRTQPIEQIPDLNLQPFPDRAAINIQEYIHIWREYHGKGAVSLITARGCPYKCNWCSHAVFGYTHRRRSPQNVADEVELIRSTYNPELLWYADDVFTINHRWLFAYAEALDQRGLNTPFETISREDRLNEEVVKTLAKMGCYRLWIGAESGSQRILDAMERQTDVERVKAMTRLLKKYGIESGMFIMLGYEGEEFDDLELTVQTLKDANPDTFLTTVAYPIAGTKYYEKVSDRVIPLKAWEEGSDRDNTVAGRHSRRYYRHATRWMVGEVSYHQQRISENPDYLRMAKSFVNAKMGRIGMTLTQHQNELGQQ